MTFQSVSDQDQILIQCVVNSAVHDLILAYTFLLHFIPNHIFITNAIIFSLTAYTYNFERCIDTFALCFASPIYQYQFCSWSIII